MAYTPVYTKYAILDDKIRARGAHTRRCELF